MSLGVEYGTPFTMEGPALISNANQIAEPYFLNGTTGWVFTAASWAASNFAREALAFEGSTGEFVGRLTGTKDATSTQRNLAAVVSVPYTSNIVVPGHKYCAELLVNSVDNTNQGYQLRVDWYNEGSFVSSSPGTALITANGVNKLQLFNLEAPAGANAATFVFQAFSTLSGDTVDIRINGGVFREQGQRVVWNNDTVTDFIGILNPESTGLDSAEIREDAQDSTENDGGVHGNFFYGRRPIVLQGTINSSSATDRNNKVAKLKTASNAMRANARLQWKPQGAVNEVFTEVRRQQPLRVSKGYVKDFFLALVAADARVYSVNEVIASSTFQRLTTAALSPTTVTNTGAIAWANPENAKAEDSVYATAALTVGQTTGLLYANFSPGLPANAELTTVRAEILRNSTAEGGVEETVVQLGKKSTELFGENKALGTWGTNLFTIGIREFLNVAQPSSVVNTGTFGLGIKVIDLVAASARVDNIKAKFTYNVEQFVEVENEGDAETDLIIEIIGPVTNPIIENVTTGKKLSMTTEVGLGEGNKMIVNTANRTITKGGVNAYGALNFAESSWFKLIPGRNKIKLTSTSSVGGFGAGGRSNGVTKMTVRYRHAFI